MSMLESSAKQCANRSTDKTFLLNPATSLIKPFCLCFSLLKLLGVVDEAGFDDGAAEDGGGPLVAGEGGCDGEPEEVEHVLVHAEGAAVVQVQRAHEDGAGQVPHRLGTLDVAGNAGISTLELVWLVFHIGEVVD